MPAPTTALRQEVRHLVELAWPSILGQLSFMLMGVVDLALVGRLGEGAIASLAAGHMWSMGVVVGVMGVIQGLDPFFSQAVGSGDRRALGVALTRSLVIGLVLSLPVAALHLWAGPGLRLLGQPESVIPLAARWCQIQAIAMPPALLFTVLRQFLQGMGLVKPAMRIGVGANLVNLVLAAVLVDRFGVEGSSIATAVVRLFMPLALLWACREELRSAWAGWAPAKDLLELWRMLRVGLPVGLQVVMEVWAFACAGLMMGWIGPTALAANAVALNLSSVSFMVPMGIGAAAATRVGNLVGAERPWSRAGWTAVVMGAGVMSVSALVFASVPQALAHLYTQDPAVVALAATLIPIAAIFQLFDGTQVVAFGVLRGAGDTRVPALANLLGYWCFGLPLGWYLAFRQGLEHRGIWFGLVAGLSSVAALLLVRLVWRVRQGPIRVLQT